MINPETLKPYTSEEVIASATADGIDVDHDEVHSLFDKYKLHTEPISESDFLPRPKKRPTFSGHVCTVEQALKNAPKLKKDLLKK